jgi:putative photosynthetic complex assembly protein
MSTPITQGRPMVIPRWMVHAAGIGLLGLLVAVGALRLSGWNPSIEPGAVVVQRSLSFADMPDGAVQVVDTASGQTLAVMRGEQGFLRGILRGLARDRRQHSVGSAPPYLLSLRDDGRLLISDPSTGQRIDLASFGPDNAAVFTRWLPPQTRSSASTGAPTP